VSELASGTFPEIFPIWRKSSGRYLSHRQNSTRHGVGRGSGIHVRPLNCKCIAGDDLEINGNVSWYGKPRFSDVESENIRIDQIIPSFLGACPLTTKTEEVLHSLSIVAQTRKQKARYEFYLESSRCLYQTYTWRKRNSATFAYNSFRRLIFLAFVSPNPGLRSKANCFSQH
jgi:hypothetical protein